LTRPKRRIGSHGKNKKMRMPGASGAKTKQERAAFIHSLTSKGIEYKDAVQRWKNRRK